MGIFPTLDENRWKFLLSLARAWTRENFRDFFPVHQFLNFSLFILDFLMISWLQLLLNSFSFQLFFLFLLLIRRTSNTFHKTISIFCFEDRHVHVTSHFVVSAAAEWSAHWIIWSENNTPSQKGDRWKWKGEKSSRYRVMIYSGSQCFSSYVYFSFRSIKYKLNKKFARWLFVVASHRMKIYTKK